MRLIEADAVIHVQTYNEMTEDWCVKETTVENALNYWADEGCPSTVDAVPVEFIESQIKSAEWTLTHIGNSDYYGNTCEELSLKCYILRSLINKWRDEK